MAKTPTSPYDPDLGELRAWLEKMLKALRFIELVTAIVALSTRMRDVNLELTQRVAQLRRNRPRCGTRSCCALSLQCRC